MRWYNILTSIRDSPTYLLIGIVLLAIIIAIILTLFEKKIKKHPETKTHISLSFPTDIRIKKIRTITHIKKTPQEKLDAISGIIKELIKELIPQAQREEYSILTEKLKKINEPELARLSEKMMHAYYFPEKISNEKINEFSSELIAIINIKNIEKHKEKMKSPGILTKIINAFKSEFKEGESHKKEIRNNEPEINLKDSNSEKIKTFRKHELSKTGQESEQLQAIKKIDQFKHLEMKDKDKEEKQKVPAEPYLENSNNTQWSQKLKNLIFYQKEFNKLNQSMYQKLLEAGVETQDIGGKDSLTPEEYQKLEIIRKDIKKAKLFLSNNRLTFQDLFNSVYKDSSDNQKKVLKKLSEEWQKEAEKLKQKELINKGKIPNPLKLFKEEAKLFKNYTSKFQQITMKHTDPFEYKSKLNPELERQKTEKSKNSGKINNKHKTKPSGRKK